MSTKSSSTYSVKSSATVVLLGGSQAFYAFFLMTYLTGLLTYYYLRQDFKLLSLFSTLGGLLISGLPKLLDFFQNKNDQKHELALAQIQVEMQLQMMAQGFAAQERMEEIRTDQIAMQTDAEMTVAAYDHDKKIMDKASKWVVNFVGTVRPMVTYIFVLELCAINAWIAYYVYSNPHLVLNMEDLIRLSDIIFSSDEMAMLGGIIGFWFGSRSWAKK